MKITNHDLALVGILVAAAIASRLVPNAEDRTLVLIITTVLGARFGAAALFKPRNESIAQLQETTENVEKQTNGVLDQRIRASVRHVLDERDRGAP